MLNKALADRLWRMPQSEFLDLYRQRHQLGTEAGKLEAKALLYHRCYTDLDLFARVYFPHYCRFPFNQFHRESFAEHDPTARGVRRARGAPRGYAKSTFKALIELIHATCYATEDFVVVISNTQGQSNGKLKDIRSEILQNDLLVADYGIRFPRANPGETAYIVECSGHQVMFAAYGAGAEIRGIRFGAKRPTRIVCDDVEHSEEVLNEEIRNKYEDWYFQVVSNIGDTQTNIEFVGTVLHRDSLLSHLLSNPAYHGRLYKAVISWATNTKLWDQWRAIYTNLDNDNRLAESELFYKQNEDNLLAGVRVLWPEKESYLWLMKEMVEKGRRAFMKEKQNEPMSAGEVLFEHIHWYHETVEKGEPGIRIEKSGVFVPMRVLRAYGALDPATGQTKAKGGKLGDFASLIVGLQDQKGRLFVHEDWTKRVGPSKYIDAIFDHHAKYTFEKFAVETNLYRNLLLPNIMTERKRREQELQRELRIPFYDVENVENKQKRIYTLEPKVNHGYILFNRTLSTVFMNMLQDFPHAEHDDGPDCLEILWGLVNNRYKASPLSLSAMGGR